MQHELIVLRFIILSCSFFQFSEKTKMKSLYEVIEQHIQKRFDNMFHDERPHPLHHLPHPPFFFPHTTLVGGSKSFPGNKSRAWPAAFDVYFSRPFTPCCLDLFCVCTGTTPPSTLTPKLFFQGILLRLTLGQGMSCT